MTGSIRRMLEAPRGVQGLNTYAAGGPRRSGAGNRGPTVARISGYDAASLFSTWLYRIAPGRDLPPARHAAASAGRFRSSSSCTRPPDCPRTSRQRRSAAPVSRIHRAARRAQSRALLLVPGRTRLSRDADILGISETNVSTKINRLKERVRRFGETHGTR